MYSERSNRTYLEAHHHGKVIYLSLPGIWSVASETYMSMVALKRDLYRYFEICYIINHVGYMNVICEYLSLHYLFIWMDSVNFLIFNFYMNWICNYFFYLLLIWMESVNLFYHLFIWMESVNVFDIVCLDEWDLWMFSLLFVKMNGLLWLIWLLGIWRHFQQYFNCDCNQF